MCSVPKTGFSKTCIVLRIDRQKIVLRQKYLFRKLNLGIDQGKIDRNKIGDQNGNMKIKLMRSQNRMLTPGTAFCCSYSVP